MSSRTRATPVEALGTPGQRGTLQLAAGDRAGRDAVESSGKTPMEILVRLFVWMLNFIYPRAGSAAVALTEDPMEEIVTRQYEEERKAQRADHIVAAFKSTASAVHGAVDYDEMKWDSFVKVVETPEQFVFYGERSVQKIIAKSGFTDRREVVTLRRVIRRRVAVCDLRDD